MFYSRMCQHSHLGDAGGPARQEKAAYCVTANLILELTESRRAHCIPTDKKCCPGSQVTALWVIVMNQDNALHRWHIDSQ